MMTSPILTGCIQQSAVSAPFSSRINTLDRQSKQQPDLHPAQGATPWRVSMLPILDAREAIMENSIMSAPGPLAFMAPASTVCFQFQR